VERLVRDAKLLTAAAIFWFVAFGAMFALGALVFVLAMGCSLGTCHGTDTLLAIIGEGTLVRFGLLLTAVAVGWRALWAAAPAHPRIRSGGFLLLGLAGFGTIAVALWQDVTAGVLFGFWLGWPAFTLTLVSIALLRDGRGE